MPMLESVVEVQESLAVMLPSQPEWVQKVAADVQKEMRAEAAKFGKALIGAPELVDTREKPGRLILPPAQRMVELVFRCSTT